MTELLSSLIPLISVAVGAWIGNVLTRRASREQVLFSRAHERREEILTRVYGLVLETRDAYWRVCTNLRYPPSETMHEYAGRFKKAKVQLSDSIGELQRFYRMNAIWLTPELCNRIEYVITLFSEQDDELIWEAIGRASMPDNLSDNTDDIEKRRRQFGKDWDKYVGWLKQDGNPSIKVLEKEFRSVLGVSTSQDLAKPYRKWHFWK